MIMKKMRIFFLLLVSHTSAFAAFSTHILGRDLNMPLLGNIGHIGISATPCEISCQILEVMNDDKHVIQLNRLEDFKNTSRFWGGRYGIASEKSAVLRILREGNFQSDLDCTDYTAASTYAVNHGYTDSEGKIRCTRRGQFRCDTFIYHLLTSNDHPLPLKNGIAPRIIFNAFPYAESHANYSKADDSHLHSGGVSKKYLQLDAMSVSANVSEIRKLISLFWRNQDDDSRLKHKIIPTIHHIFERECLDAKSPDCKTVEADIISFYTDVIEKQTLVSDISANIVIRGLLNLRSNPYLLKNHAKMNAFLDDLHQNFDAKTRLRLKIDIMQTNMLFEEHYIPEIIAILEKENSAALYGTFNRYLVSRLSHNFDNAFTPGIREQLRLYSESIRNLHDHIRQDSAPLRSRSLPGILDYGAWLEADALILSATPEDAAKRIADFLGTLKTESDKEHYVAGLSNSTYLQKAFAREPALVDFKKRHNDVYENTVGLPLRAAW